MDKTTKEIKTTEVVVKDFYGEKCLADSPMISQSKNRKPEGLVEVYDWAGSCRYRMYTWKW